MGGSDVGGGVVDVGGTVVGVVVAVVVDGGVVVDVVDVAGGDVVEVVAAGSVVEVDSVERGAPPDAAPAVSSNAAAAQPTRTIRPRRNQIWAPLNRRMLTPPGTVRARSNHCTLIKRRLHHRAQGTRTILPGDLRHVDMKRMHDRSAAAQRWFYRHRCLPRARPNARSGAPTPIHLAGPNPHLSTVMGPKSPGSSGVRPCRTPTSAGPVKPAQNVRSAGAPRDAPFESVHQFVVLLRVEVTVPVEHDGYRRVARHHRDLLRVRAVGDPERLRRCAADRECVAERARRPRLPASRSADGRAWLESASPRATGTPTGRRPRWQWRVEPARRRRSGGVAPIERPPSSSVDRN